MPDLVIFDCDGVLVDSEILADEALLAVLTKAGVPARPEMMAGCFGLKQADILAKIARDTGVAVPDQVRTELWPATRAVFDRALQPMPGVVDFIARLGNRPRCVASSSSVERIRFSLTRTGLDGAFGANLFSSDMVARGKPAPDLFLLAAERMGVAPERCAVIEDSVFGVEGARAAGMRAIGFTGGSHIGPQHGSHLLASGAEAALDSFAAIERRLFAP